MPWKCQSNLLPTWSLQTSRATVTASVIMPWNRWRPSRSAAHLKVGQNKPTQVEYVDQPPVIHWHLDNQPLWPWEGQEYNIWRVIMTSSTRKKSIALLMHTIGSKISGPDENQFNMLQSCKITLWSAISKTLFGAPCSVHEQKMLLMLSKRQRGYKISEIQEWSGQSKKSAWGSQFLLHYFSIQHRKNEEQA